MSKPTLVGSPAATSVENTLTMQQHTIKDKFTVTGVGLHTGARTTVTFQPAPANHGIRFKRVDLEGTPVIKADASKVVSTNRCTTIGQGDAHVATVEHALSALSGMGVDNALIEIDGVEMPILDGSAQEYTHALKAIGLEAQDAERDFFVVEKAMRYKDEETGAELVALPADDYEVTTLIDFNSPILNKQHAQMQGVAAYAEEVAPSRTFCFLRELEALHDHGLIRGGDVDNAVVIVDEVKTDTELAALAKKLGKDKFEVEKTGYLNNTELRFPNEPARHKLLDVIGDLSLVGAPIKGKIVATKPGHKANVAFAQQLRAAYQAQKKLRNVPKYDPNVAPLYTTQQIMELLPHRYPMLMLDKIIELSDQHVVGVKNITMNEHILQGHFPGNPIFPGVLQVEAMAQAGGIFALSLEDDPYGYDTYFLKIDNTKFRNKVVPGDTLMLKMVLSAPIRRGIVQMHGTAYVGNTVVSEGDFTAQIVKRSS